MKHHDGDDLLNWEIARQIVEQRAARQLSQSELAALCGTVGAELVTIPTSEPLERVLDAFLRARMVRGRHTARRVAIRRSPA